jgi:tetratricopeptide (TPR) repeat protein
MEGAVTAAPRPRALGVRWTLDPGSIVAWCLPVALVTYLGMRDGGFDAVIADQVAIAIWWALFLIVALRLARLRLTRSARVGLTLLIAYGAWNAASLIWTESAERTMGDVTLMLLYVPLAVLVAAIRGRDWARLMLNGLSIAILAVAAVALLSRFHFAWFGIPEVDQALPRIASKLSYPLGYWNALAALVAMGVPLLLHAATGARSLIRRALAAGGVPVLAVCVYLTGSRGGAAGVVIGAVLFLLLARDRLPKLAVTAVCGGGAALLVAAAASRSAVRQGLRTALGADQGYEMIAITLVVVAGVALIAYAIGLVDAHVRPARRLSLSRRRTSELAAACVAVAIVAFLAAGGPHYLSREWRQFQTGGSSSLRRGSTIERFQDVTGNGRYQYWQAAIRAADAHPWTGTGAGTFVYWWARNGTVNGGFVEDAHSLYLQALAELGYPGMILIAAFMLWVLGCGAAGAARVTREDRRLEIAAATAGAAVFAFSAAFEWIWLIPVLPVAMLMLAAVIFAPDDGGRRARRAGRRLDLRIGARIAGAAVSLAAVIVVALPMAATASVRQSQALASGGDLRGALESARAAVRLTPYAAAAWEQEALVLEAGGDLRDALAAARSAATRSSTDSSTWLVLSRLEARTGHAAVALTDYRRARALDPHSPIFADG